MTTETRRIIIRRQFCGRVLALAAPNCENGEKFRYLGARAGINLNAKDRLGRGAGAEERCNYYLGLCV